MRGAEQGTVVLGGVQHDGHLESGAFAPAIEALQGQPSLAAAVARAGLQLNGKGAEAAERAMRGALAMERKGLEMHLAYLGTLGNNAPFIGLFGTVIGVILAFEELGQATSAGTTSQAASAAVMAAIAEALVATAVGIGVALPAVAAYNYFQRQTTVLLDDAEALLNLVLAYLTSQATSETRRSHGTTATEKTQRRTMLRQDAV